MAERKRRHTPREKVKESQEAKRRQRDLRGEFRPGRLNTGTHGINVNFINEDEERPPAKAAPGQPRLFDSVGTWKSKPSTKSRRKPKPKVTKRDPKVTEKLDQFRAKASSGVRAEPSPTKAARIRKTKKTKKELVGLDEDLNALRPKAENYEEKGAPDVGKVSGESALGKARRHVLDIYNDARSSGMDHQGARSLAIRTVLNKEHPYPGLSETTSAQDLMPDVRERTRVPDEDDEVWNAAKRQGGKNMSTQRGASPGTKAAEGPVRGKGSAWRGAPGDAPTTKGITGLSTLKKTATPEELEHVKQRKKDKTSPLYSGSYKEGQEPPGVKRRERIYWSMVKEQGFSGDEAEEYLKSEHRGRPTKQQLKGKAVESMDKRTSSTAGYTGEKDRYGSGIPSESDYTGSIRKPGVDSIKDIQKKNPDLSMADVVRMQQIQRQYADQLDKNQLWSLESKRANLLNDPNAKGKLGGDSNRVVFFTTSLGFPSASVPANSLLGQYVIRKRKKMMLDDKRGYTKSQLRGEFPEPVRDAHLFEVATGISIGAEGRYGLFRNAGIRRGAQRSKGFGKDIPIGGTVLRDNQGHPVYDDKGNIRFTEGGTRPFSVKSSNTGFRVFVG